MTASPRWIGLEAILSLHKTSLERFGGSGGIRDSGLLDSAMARPRNRFVYAPETSLFGLAAAYCFGIARNHPFFDGNKRAAFAAMVLFLEINGQVFAGAPIEAEEAVLAVASGEMTEAQLERWLMKRCVFPHQ